MPSPHSPWPRCPPGRRPHPAPTPTPHRPGSPSRARSRRLYADGKLTFSARTWTDHTFSGDIRHARFQLKDSGGRTLFTTGTFEPSVYSATVNVTQWASC
ncbi:hypothetical protein AB0A70_31630 [Streptomyces morookaense]|uniref:hypothetical protein n=1 Tax=Streptomyces morookaense TaxID=1970 RepID=UPI0033FB87E7